jgi:hypothetical protein
VRRIVELLAAMQWQARTETGSVIVDLDSDRRILNE